MKKLVFLLIIVLVGFYSCTKENIITTTETTASTAKTFNCLTTTNEAASIQLLSPLSPKSWFNLSFCFTPPTQTIPNPVIYTNGDSLPVTLQIFVNKVFVGPSNKWVSEKVDEYFYQPVFHPYPTPVTRFIQKPALQDGTFVFPVNFKFEKKGLYNKFINSWSNTNDTTLYNWDAYDFGMHSATTNGYAYVRLVIKSDK